MAAAAAVTAYRCDAFGTAGCSATRLKRKECIVLGDSELLQLLHLMRKLRGETRKPRGAAVCGGCLPAVRARERLEMRER